MNFLVIITIFGIFLVIPIFENAYAEYDFNIEIPFYYLHNFQNFNNYQLENNNIIPNQFIIYLQEGDKKENNPIDPL